MLCMPSNRLWSFTYHMKMVSTRWMRQKDPKNSVVLRCCWFWACRYVVLDSRLYQFCLRWKSLEIWEFSWIFDAGSKFVASSGSKVTPEVVNTICYSQMHQFQFLITFSALVGHHPFNFCHTGIFGKRGQPREVYYNFRKFPFENPSSIWFASRNFWLFTVGRMDSVRSASQITKVPICKCWMGTIVLCEWHTVLKTSTCVTSEFKQPETATNLLLAFRNLAKLPYFQ